VVNAATSNDVTFFMIIFSLNNSRSELDSIIISWWICMETSWSACSEIQYKWNDHR